MKKLLICLLVFITPFVVSRIIHNPRTVREYNITQHFKDPESVKIKDLRKYATGKYCGKVNAKNGFGAYGGFKDFMVDENGNNLLLDDGVIGGEFFKKFTEHCIRTF